MLGDVNLGCILRVVVRPGLSQPQALEAYSVRCSFAALSNPERKWRLIDISKCVLLLF